MMTRNIELLIKMRGTGIAVGCILGLAMVLFSFAPAAASEAKNMSGPCAVEHPFKQPPKLTTHLRCPNCGMNRNMWARTRHIFKNSEGEHYTCSIHCLADMSARSGESPQDVRVAVYLSPEKMISADQASYVVGSKAPGTMTMVSKIAFAEKADADAFAAQCGGKVVSFQQALAAATQALPKAPARLPSSS